MAETAKERQEKLLKRREIDRAHAAPSVSAAFHLSQDAKVSCKHCYISNMLALFPDSPLSTDKK